MRRRVYELRVRGPISPDVLREIGALDVAEEPPLTVLRTEPTDQAGLHGMLQWLRSLGLDLLEVRRVGVFPDEAPDTVDASDPVPLGRTGDVPQEPGWPP
jgi:hypothetical protein